MINVRNFMSGNANIRITDNKGAFQVAEYDRDLSVVPQTAVAAYYSAKMNIHKRQLIARVTPDMGITIQAGAMQWFAGNVGATTGVKGVGDLLNKTIRGKVTGESAIKPEYQGDGILVLEPTYKHIILTDVEKWGQAGVILDDGLFFASEGSVRQKTAMRSNISSAMAGGEGLFNLCLQGTGIAALESPVPFDELVQVDLQNDMLKVDGSFAVAWSGTLNLTVERSGKTLIGSAASGEGLVNTYRGTGTVWMAPVK